MNRRIVIPIVTFGALFSVYGLLEATGQLGSRSATGRAAGAGGAGCAGGALPATAAADISEMTPLDDPDPTQAERVTDFAGDIIPGRYVMRLTPPQAIEIEREIPLAGGTQDQLGLGLEDRTPNTQYGPDTPEHDLSPIGNLHPDVGEALSNLAADDIQDLFEHLSKAFPGERQVGISGLYTFDSDAPLDDVLAQLGDLPEVQWVEPVGRVKAAAIPNDPYFPLQWNLPLVGAPIAWDTSRGAGMTVAVVDSGVSKDGPDGIKRLLEGGDPLDQDWDPSDLHGHGTHLAGIIAQQTNNEIGVAGLAPKVSILPVRVLDAQAKGNTIHTSIGIAWAAAMDADVILVAAGTDMPSQLMQEAVRYAVDERGAVVVAAAGNRGWQNHVQYPAAFREVIGVGATDMNGESAVYSNHGQITLSAPGGDLRVDLDGDEWSDGVAHETFIDGKWTWQLREGTSVAAAHVAAAAAMVKAVDPQRSPADVLKALTQTADDAGAEGWDPTYGHGTLDIAAAVAWAPAVAEGGDTPNDGPEIGIENIDAYPVSINRGGLSWQTEKPTWGTVEWGDGGRVVLENATQDHLVYLDGAPGETITYRITASEGADGGSGTAEVQITYPTDAAVGRLIGPNDTVAGTLTPTQIP